MLRKLIKCIAVRCNFRLTLINFLISLSTRSVSFSSSFFHAKRIFLFLFLFFSRKACFFVFVFQRLIAPNQLIRNMKFISPNTLVFVFLHLRLTPKAMGIWRFAGAFAVVKRQSECGSNTCQLHVSQPMNIGVC